MQGSGKINVLVVDDAQDLTILYLNLINSEPDMACVGTLDSADGLTEEVDGKHVDVVLLDFTMAGKPPLEAIGELAESSPKTRVLVFSGYDDPATLNKALDAGAWGLVSKHEDPMSVITAIRRVAGGEVYMPCSV